MFFECMRLHKSDIYDFNTIDKQKKLIFKIDSVNNLFIFIFVL